MKTAIFNKFTNKLSVPKLTKVQGYWQRQGFVKFIFLAVFGLFSYHSISISNTNDEVQSVQDRAHKQANSVQTKLARRGDILDRHGNILASSRLLKRVILDPSNIHPAFVPKLAEALAMDETTLGMLLAKKRAIGSRYLPIKKNLTLTDPILEKLKQLKKQRIEVCRNKEITQPLSLVDRVLNAVKFQTVVGAKTTVNKCRKERIGQALVLRQDTQRYYPKSASMAPLLGRVNAENKGGSGIENEFEHALAGVNGKAHLNFIDNQTKAYFNPEVEKELHHGKNIELTIDTDIQYHAYSAIKKSVLKHEADSGSAIILSPNGEVLAMVNYPADDPNNNSLYNPSHYRNRVLSDKVEPGSTMKPFTMLLALDQGKISAQDDELIDVSKSIGHLKTNSEVRKYGDAITVKKILQKSHNLGTVNVSERLSNEDMYSTWRKLGFSQPLGLIPSVENSGSLRHYSSWGLADKRTLSFGHGPMETNLAQLARAYLVFANEGAVPALKLIKNVASYEEKTQVFSPQATNKIAHLLDAVASWKGSGYRARIKGYDVAGKTGTAEMVVNGKYHKTGAKRTFFTGFVPVNQPKYIMAVRLDYPKKCYVYKRPDLKNSCEGSNSAAMVFSDTMKHILTNNTAIKLSSK
ncbi:MAG: penicillin-binding protein 2 [Candidatus Thioglobus sp.]|uniref:peptidoglycan D,D-transpeptidase FtsI family protein n=1 Tax=Candidatus Thioglobus sp. TaxID=2026721 RepID=UPI00261B1742|nr:penicillin-binding protein 2 [Candidatus Thioglobus sp.]MDC9726355.1 penicillin-binding protein 2 [Candidatus Thioglobus sp.]